ncbi:hypothetical protein AM588_10004944 [Phytophthora nicotianae]|uniref:Uncharacterized protein n=1 Tax=Phytophthora nicotianae TaxID=4792 RepID=A0A0W8DDC1_PHYNI|nr:hypothetical protein AM588_10004944 [Phytophthora nicotianae]
MAKKRRRSESFQADGNDARKRLAAFHARMFELPQEDAPVATPETPRVVFKAKTKKHKKRSSDADDGERVPMVKFNKVRNKKEKKKNVVNVAEKKVAVGPAVVKVPGMPNGFRKKPQKNNVEEKKKQKLKNTAVQTTQYQSLLTEKEQDDEDDGVDPLEQALSSVKAMVTEKKARKVKKMALPAPQPHMKKETEEEEDEMDPLGQALGRIKEMATKQGAKPMLKQNKGMAVASSSVEKAEDSVEVVEEQSGTKELAVNNSTGDGSNPALSMSKKKKRKKLTRAQEAKNSDPAPENIQATMNEAAKATSGVTETDTSFEAGSGNSSVLMNKMASAVENGHLSVRDPSFVSALERRVALMESNAEVMELLHPLLESLSTVRDVGCLLKQLCEHWQLERKIGLVQQVLLSSIFDDLDGNQDEILLDLPDLTGRLDFPSRLDQEDVDENGNLKGFLANEDSEYSGVEGSEEEDEEKDSDDDEDPYEGETDSDEEMEIAGCSRSRNQFIEDEADVGEEDEEEEEEDIERHDGGESSSDSD